MTTELSVGERVAQCQRRIEESPESAAAHFNLGLAEMQRGRVERAEAAYRRALELDPDLVEAWVNLGGVLLMKWDFKGCLEANQQALERRADLAQAHFNLGQAHLYLGDAPALVGCNRRVLELEPEHAAAHYFLAVGLLAADQVEAAREALARAMALGYRPQLEFLRGLERAEKNLNQIHPTPPPADAAGETKKED